MRINSLSRRSFTLLAAAAFLSLGACEGLELPTEAEENEEATLTIWTSDNSPSYIAVSVDGESVGTLTQYRTSSPTCGATSTGAIITLTVSPGTHSISARETSGSSTWPAKSITVSSGGCRMMELTK